MKRLALLVVLRLLARPDLWPEALRTWRRFTPPLWWRHQPFLPIPPREYVEFRMTTAYGHEGRPEPRDLIEFLEWCRSFTKYLRTGERL